MKRTLLFFAMLLSVIVASAKDIKTVVFTTNPIMHCENCENKIKKNLRFEKGVKSVETNVAEQRVTVGYDASKTDEAKLQKAFTKFGYEAKVVGCSEKASGCKSSASGCSGEKAGCKSAQGGCSAGQKPSCCKEGQSGSNASCCKTKEAKASCCTAANAEKKDGCGACKDKK